MTCGSPLLSDDVASTDGDLKLLVIEDSVADFQLMKRQLTRKGVAARYRRIADLEALRESMKEGGWDAVLADYSVPALRFEDGLALLRERAPDLPVILVSGSVGEERAVDLLKHGVWDFVLKDNLTRLASALERNLKEAEEHRARKTAELKLRESYAETINCLGRASEYRDNETGMHVLRIGMTTGMLARFAGHGDELAALLEQASPMHDIGKIGIPDAVLLKPGPLTAEEWTVMKRHTQIGAAILGGYPSDLIHTARQIALNHHERWDGTGYPAGLAGEAIPLSARITAVCDVFDALISERPYKHAWPADKAAGYLRGQAGRQFDAGLVEVFLNHLERFSGIGRAFPDTRPPPSPDGA